MGGAAVVRLLLLEFGVPQGYFGVVGLGADALEFGVHGEVVEGDVGDCGGF